LQQTATPLRRKKMLRCGTKTLQSALRKYFPTSVDFTKGKLLGRCIFCRQGKLPTYSSN
jgi:hypothetical protein